MPRRKGELIMLLARYDGTQIVHDHGRLWIVTGVASAKGRVYPAHTCRSLATGHVLTLYEYNFVKEGEEDAPARGG